MGGSTTGDPDDIPYSNVNDISNSADHDTKVVSVRGNKHTATHRAVPHRSAAGASASISISIPSSRLNNTKGSLGGNSAVNWHGGLCGFNSRGIKGHHSYSSSPSQAVRRYLLCVATGLLLLPLGFLIRVHVFSNSRTIIRSSEAGTLSEGSSASFRIRNQPRKPVIDLDNFDTSRFTPIPKDYQAAKAFILAASQGALDQAASRGPSSSGSAAAAAANYCIPPSRAMSWAQYDAEVQMEMAATSTTSTASGEDDDSQTQEQQAEETTAAADAGHRRSILAAATAATAAQGKETVAAQPAAAKSDERQDVDSFSDYYDVEAADDGAVPLPGVASTTAAAAAAAAASNAAGKADAADLSHYYDAEAAAASEQPLEAADSAANPDLATAAAVKPPAAATTTQKQQQSVEALQQQPKPTAAATEATTAAATEAAIAAATAAAEKKSESSKSKAGAIVAGSDAQQQPGGPVYKPAEPEQPKPAAGDKTAAAAAAAAVALSHVSGDDETTSSSNSSNGDNASNSAASSKATASTAGAAAAAATTDSTTSASKDTTTTTSTGSTTDASSTGTTTARHEEYEATYELPASAAAAAAAGSAAAIATPRPTAVANPTNIDQLQIALVNDVEFHHEVTLGLMSALQAHKDRLTVYLHDSMFKKGGGGSGGAAFDFVSFVNKAMPGAVLKDAYYKPAITKTDVAIFVSPEFSIDYYREFIRRATPRLLIVFIHEPNMELRRLQYIINMHPLVGVAALSPHVAETVKTRMRMHHVHWMMPVMPVNCDNTCWEGFAVQGKFEGARRTYATLWEEMQRHLQQQQPTTATAATTARHLQALPPPHQQQQQVVQHARLRRLAKHAASSSSRVLRDNAAGVVLPRINVLGSGKVSALGVPKELRPHVFVYQDLGYDDFYDTICRSSALLPLFNSSSGYLTDKISSSVLVSVAAAVPMIVPEQFLDVYTVFAPKHVILLKAGGDEVQAMHTLSQPSAAAALAAKRAALQELRQALNQQATAKLDGLMSAAIGKPHATTKQD